MPACRTRVADLQRFVLTGTVHYPGGSHLPGSPAIGHLGPAGPGSARGTPHPPVTAVKGTPVLLDPDSAAYRAIGGENLRPFEPGLDEYGRAALGN